MKQETYRKIYDWFSARPAALQVLRVANSVLPAAVYLVYGALLVVLALRQDARFWPVLAVPAAVFVLGTVLRRALGRPRPYEVLELPPLIPREKAGYSLPSRHAFSAAVIAVAAGYVLPPLGVALAVWTLLIALQRVLACVHFVRDVVFGAAFGAVLGVAGLWLWPW